MTRHFMQRTLGVFAVLVLASCFGDSTGPGEFRMGSIAIAPSFDVRATRLVDVNRVRIRLVRGNGTAALDTIVNFPAGTDSLQLPLQVPIVGVRETFSLFLRLIDDPAGDTVFASGPDPVEAVGGGGTPQPVLPVLLYTGTGANAVGVRFVQAPGQVFFQDSVLFTAEAVDVNNAVIPNTPILFSSSDTTRARVPRDSVGRVVARTTRGTVNVTAELLRTSTSTTPPSVSSPLVVQPVPNSIQVQSGDGQSAAVGSALPVPVVARVRAADNLGVQGVVVTWAVTAGGGTLSALTDTTDASGDASVTWTLGGTLGAQTVTATAVGVTGGTTTATATGLVGAPYQVGFVVQPAGGNANQALTPAIQVAAQDSFGNTVPGFTQNVAVALGANPTGAALGGTTTVAGIGGIATFADLTLDTLGAGFTLVATATGLVSDTSAAFSITGGVPAQLVITQEPTNALAGAAITPAVTVEVRDVQNALVASATNAVTIAIRPGTGTAGAALTGTTTVAAVNGVATFTGIAVDSAGASYALIVTSPALGADTSVAVTISVGAATQIVITTAPPGSVTAGAAFGLTATARDAVGNTATGFTGPVTVAVVAGSGITGATLGGTTTVNAVAGVANFTGLTLDSAGTGYLLEVATAGLPPDTTAAIVVTAGAAARLVVTTQPPTSVAAGNTLGLTVSARDAVGNVATTFTGPVTAAIVTGTGTAGAGLAGTNPVAAVAGVATFTNLAVDSAGIGYQLALSAAGLVPDTTTAFAVTPGTAIALTFATSPPTSATFQSPFVTSVSARDALGNVDASYTGAVTLAIATNPASGTLGGTTTVNAVAGIATFSGVSIDNIGSGYTLTATATGLSAATSGTMDVVAPANVNAWINTAGGAWSTASNWSQGVVPSATDTVFIRQSGTYTVTVDQSVTLARLDVGAPLGAQTVTLPANTMTFAGDAAFAANTAFDVAGGTIAGAGVVDVFGSLGWQAGAFNGGNGTMRVQSGGTLALGGASTLTLSAYTLELAGSAIWTGTHQVNSGNSGTLRVLASGVLDIQGDPSFFSNLGGPTFFQNQGTVLRTSSPGVALLAVGFENDGQATAVTGTLRLSGGSAGAASDGVYAANSGATLEFGGGTHTLGASGGVGGAGTVLVSNGVVDASGGWAVTSPTTVTGGALNYNNASGGATGSLVVSGGTLGGSGLLTVTGAMTWSGGALNGTGGTVAVAPGATLAMGGATTLTLSNYTLELGGTGTWTGTHQVNSGNNGTFRVLAGGTLDIQGDPSFFNNLGGPTFFQNLGTVQRTTSAGAALLAVGFENDGQATAASGSLVLAGGSAGATSDGTYTASAGGTLDFGNGTHTLGAAGTVDGAGTVAVTNGSVSAAGAWTVTGLTVVSGGTLAYGGAAGTTTDLAVAGGTLGGATGGLLTVAGTMSWTSGALQGSGGVARVAPGGSLVMGGTSTLTLSNYTLELGGTGTWTGTHQVNSGNSGTLRVLAGGSLDIQGDPNFFNNLGGPTFFQNLGTVQRTTSPGVAQIAVGFENDGQATVTSGTLELGGGSAGATADGTYTANAGGTLDFSNGTHTLGAAGTVDGGGTVQVSGGSVDATGAWGVTGTTVVVGGTLGYGGAGGTTTNLSVTGGTLAGPTGGLLTVTGAMTWSAGALNGTGGTVSVAPSGTLAMGGATTITLNNYTLELGGTGTWTGTHQVNSGNNGTLRVLAGGTLDIQGDPNFLNNLGGATFFQNLGTVLRTTSAGVATVDAQYDSDGQTTVTSGTLRLTGGTGAATADGAYTAVSGGTLDFNSGTHTLGALGTMNGTGIVQVSGGAVNASGAWAVTGTTQLTGGTLSHAGASGSTANLNVVGGTLAGPAGSLLTVTGAMAWSAGGFSGTGGTAQVASGATFTMGGATTLTLNNFTVELGGTGTWTGAHQVNSGNSGVLRILGTGVLDIQGDPNFLVNLGGGTTFENLGSLVRSTSLGTAVIDPVLASTAGTVTVSSGVLSLTGGGSLANAVTVSGGTLAFDAGTYGLAHLLSVTGAGTVVLNGATLTQAAATDTASFSTLTLASGTLGHIGVLRFTTLLDWSGTSSMSGTGGKTLVPLGGTLAISGAGTKTLNNAHILELGGTGTWTGAHQVNSGNGGVFRVLPTGTLDIQGDPNFLVNLGGGTTLENLGALMRTTSPGVATIDPVFTSTAGTVTVSGGGTLSLTGGGTLGGNVTVSFATLAFDAGNFGLAHGLNLAGAGTVVLNGATLSQATAADTATLSTLTLAGGTMGHIGVVQVGALDWSGTTSMSGTGGKTLVPLGGTLAISGAGTKTLNNAHILEIGGTGTWTGAQQMNTGNGAVLRVLSGGSLDVQGDPNVLVNLGGAATLDVQGSFLRSLSGGTAVLDVSVIDTVASAFQVNSGTLQLTGNSRSGGSPTIAAGAVLELASGAHAFQGGTAFTGGGLLRITSGTLAVDTGVIASAVNVDLLGGSMAHEGTLQVSGGMNWDGGNITSNTIGTGGTTRILSGATLVIATAAARTLSGAHTIQVDGTAFYTGSGNINSGNGARINVGFTAIFEWQGDGQILSNLGGTQSGFEVEAYGTLRRTVSPNPAVLDFLFGMGNFASTLDLQSGPLQLTGGGSPSGLQGSANTTAGVSRLELLGGAFQLADNMAINGTGGILVGAGTLDLNGFTLAVAGDFATGGTGTVVMQNPADVLDINGSAAFGSGNSSAGQLTAGTMFVGGNFSQSGNTASFAPTGSHRTVLDGAGGTVQFTNATTSFFHRLDVANTAGTVQLLTDAIVQDTFRMAASTAVLQGVSPARLRTNGHVQGNPSSQFLPFVWEKAGLTFQDTGTVSPDTTVFLAAGDAITLGPIANYTWNNLRIAADTVSIFNSPITTNQGGKGGDVVVGSLPTGSGTLAFFGSGASLTVNGNLRVEGNGAVKMHFTGNQATVTGNATFAGRAMTGLDTTGTLSIQGDFVQAGNTAAFVPTGSHVTRFSRPGDAVVQNITFTNPTTSFFDSLDLNRGSGARGTVTFLSDARVNSGLSIQNSTDATGPTARISVAGGALRIPTVTTSGTLQNVRAVEMSLAPVIGVGSPLLAPDTAVFNGSVAALPVAANIQYGTVRVSTAGNFSLASDTIAGHLWVTTGAAVVPAGVTFLAQGDLVTAGSGRLTMQQATGTLTIGGAAAFGGGSTAGFLTAGTLRLRGNFVQNNGPTFQASSTHTTVFENAVRNTIFMTDPGTGAAQSRFGVLHLDRLVSNVSEPVTVELLTSIQAASLFDTTTNAPDSIITFQPGPIAVTADNIQGFGAGGFYFQRATLSLTSGTASQFVNYLEFQVMDPTSTYLTLVRDDGFSLSFSNVRFGTPHTTGRFISAAGGTTAQFGTFQFFSSLPSTITSAAGDYILINPFTQIQWNGGPFNP